MTRLEYWLNIAVVLLFIGVYYWTGKDEVAWLFAATFQLIHAQAERIRADIKEGKK